MSIQVRVFLHSAPRTIEHCGCGCTMAMAGWVSSFHETVWYLGEFFEDVRNEGKGQMHSARPRTRQKNASPMQRRCSGSTSFYDQVRLEVQALGEQLQ